MNKEKLKQLPGAKKVIAKLKAQKEFHYDKSFFLRNFAHSKETKNKLGYNMLFISHSLEKGLSSKRPRRFGVLKIKELQKLIERYQRYENYSEDFEFINAINILRQYKKFYEEKSWTDADEYIKVKQFLKPFSKIEKMDIGGHIIKKADFQKMSTVDYESFLSSRHSVREFLPIPVKESDIQKAVGTAILSPSACNRQMCKVYYILDEERKKKVVEIGQGFNCFEKQSISPIVITFDINANIGVGERNQGWFNSGLFSMNLVNALHSLGIGSCFCQFGNPVSQEERLKKTLNIPKNERIAVIIACGYYCEETLIPYSPRKKLEDIYRKR